MVPKVSMVMAFYIPPHSHRVAKVRKEHLKNDVFQVREKLRNFVVGQGNLERLWEVRDKPGNLEN